MSVILLMPMVGNGVRIDDTYARVADYVFPLEYTNKTIKGSGAQRYGIRYGIERFYIGDISGPGPLNLLEESDIAIMWDRPPRDASFVHGDGINVLYMDGHVAFETKLGPVSADTTYIHSAAYIP